MTTAKTRRAIATVRILVRPPAVTIDSQSRQARRNSCRANQARVPGRLTPRRLFGDQSEEGVFEARILQARAAIAGLPAQLFEGALRDQPPARDDADPIGHALGDVEDVRGHDHGAAGGDVLAQHGLDLPGGAGIEPGEGLVEDDDPGLVHERARQRHLLAHALGEALAALMGMGTEAEPVDQPARAGFGMRGVDAPEPADEFEIFERRQLVVDHRLVGNPGHHLLGRDGIGQRVDAEDRDRPGVRPQQAHHHAQGGGLAGAVGAEQGVEFAGADGEVEPIDRRAVEGLPQIADFDGKRGIGTHQHPATRPSMETRVEPSADWFPRRKSRDGNVMTSGTPKPANPEEPAKPATRRTGAGSLLGPSSGGAGCSRASYRDEAGNDHAWRCIAESFLVSRMNR